jgi:hypothetical protein
MGGVQARLALGPGLLAALWLTRGQAERLAAAAQRAGQELGALLPEQPLRGAFVLAARHAGEGGPAQPQYVLRRVEAAEHGPAGGLGSR